ncbi:TerD family protein [Deinococcus hopiensis]|uniref:Tellurium resistance protein TerD n=1 Tax=Deinococcus hopiensis KR-140 TaxID=695939 RepID=A0A1W1U9Q1_9DEIO|nr:TerD family protein [Deinococcus hopiensis]SMB77818.1 tellurium resistance protein TerD [Deinococcus hopiensis KR-140]
MTIQLTSGNNTSLTANHPGLQRVQVGLGWNFPEGSEPFDLDASALLVQSNGQVRSDNDFVFYNNAEDIDMSVRYGGDSLNGIASGDDEVIVIELNRVPVEISKVVLCATIHEAVGRDFSNVNGAYIRLLNLENSEEIARFDLQENFLGMTAMLFGEVYRHNAAWKFRALGMGLEGGLRALVSSFGVNVD